MRWGRSLSEVGQVPERGGACLKARWTSSQSEVWQVPNGRGSGLGVSWSMSKMGQVSESDGLSPGSRLGSEVGHFLE